MMEAVLSGAAANRSQALRQGSATAAASANTRFARRLPLGYWNTVSIGCRVRGIGRQFQEHEVGGRREGAASAPSRPARRDDADTARRDGRADGLRMCVHRRRVRPLRHRAHRLAARLARSPEHVAIDVAMVTDDARPRPQARRHALLTDPGVVLEPHIHRARRPTRPKRRTQPRRHERPECRPRPRVAPRARQAPSRTEVAIGRRAFRVASFPERASARKASGACAARAASIAAGIATSQPHPQPQYVVA